jgi:hypothetical protein
MIITLLIVAGWFLCGFTHYGFCLAYFKSEWPTLVVKNYKKNIFDSISLSLFGPISLIGYFLIRGSDGFKRGFKIL